MSNYSGIAKFVFNRILKESASNKFGAEDAYYEYPATEMGRAGRKRSRRKKKALPPGLTKEEGEILTKVKRRAHRIDMSLGSFLGIRFGWGSVIGIIPGLGDVADTLLALLVLRTCMKLPLPTPLLVHMLINIAIDFVIGIVPIIGDLADGWYKCNTRNAVLLEKHLREVGRKRLKRDYGGNNGGHVVEEEEDPSLPGYHSDTEMEDERVDLESQVSAPERARRRGDERYAHQEGGVVESDGRRVMHSKSLKKNQSQRDNTKRGRR